MQVKIGFGNLAEPDFQRNGLPPELPNVQMRSGLTILSNPILRGKSSENFSATLSKGSARRRHWGQGFPLQARFDIKTLCLRQHRPRAMLASAPPLAGLFSGWQTHKCRGGAVRSSAFERKKGITLFCNSAWNDFFLRSVLGVKFVPKW
jgi:hypothetical protein